MDLLRNEQRIVRSHNLKNYHNENFAARHRFLPVLKSVGVDHYVFKGNEILCREMIASKPIKTNQMYKYYLNDNELFIWLN